MKKISTILLFIFGVVVIAILIAGLISPQNNNSQTTTGLNTGSLTQNVIVRLTSSRRTVYLDMTEISKHNKETDCWMLISGKVYDITSYFGQHPGGNGAMVVSCGKDATDAYDTKNPYATSATGGQRHSAVAVSLLNNYYLGDLNQKLN